MCHKLGFTGAVYEELYFQYCQRIAARPVLSVDPLRPYLPADQVVDHARDWLRTVGEGPFFIWLHLMDAHSPYYPPEQALAWMGQYDFKASRALYANSYWRRDDLKANRLRRIREEVVWLYDAGIRWVDAQISRLVETLTALGQWENCIFAFTADHGEEFLDHGGRFRPPRVNEELVHVPFFLRLPNIREGRPVVSPFSLLHLAPTLLDALDLPFPAEFRGRSFWPQLCDGGGWNEPAIVECVTTCTNPWQVETRFGPRVLAVRELRYKLVLDFRSSSEQLFDLDADPQELHPLPATREAAMRGRLLERARKHLVTSLQGRDPDVRLKALLRNLRLRLTE
jgi:arylsulfatase A-like enzyme